MILVGLPFRKFCKENNLRVDASNVETVVEVGKRPPFGSPLHTVAVYFMLQARTRDGGEASAYQTRPFLSMYTLGVGVLLAFD
jgi:hypothetical protein